MAEIAVLGNFVVDIIGKPIDRLPERGRLAMIDTLETHPGGNGPNTSGALGRLGADVAALGRVGDDLYGRFLIEKLEGWGVDTRGVVKLPEAVTGLTLVAVDSSGERSFIHHYGANADFSPADIDWSQLAGVRHFHLSGYFVLPRLEGPAAASVLAEAQRRGMSTSLDMCWDRAGGWMETMRPCLPHLTFLMPSEEEAQQLTGRTSARDVLAALHDAGARSVVLKLGERGCIYSGEGGSISPPAFDVSVRETTGAGDCFIAGFLLSQLRGRDLERSLWFGNACGARSVTAVGGVTGMAGAEEIEDWASRLPVRKGL
ncbi:MAG: carbohydrate kinase family protein [Actinomycetota bacterium]